MNALFLNVLGAPESDRYGLFLETANRLGVPIQHIEKDFWVCLVLDLLFNGRETNEPRLLFKGGTSLSKAYSLISRFSEDIDITVFREDLGQNITLGELEGLSGKQQRKYFENIKNAAQQYICHQLKPRLEKQFIDIFKQIGSHENLPSIDIDSSDKSEQTLLVRFHSVLSNNNSYIIPAVKIEGGAKSALDPHQLTSIYPYVAKDINLSDFMVKNVVTINAERTFWDKIIILHGIRRWYDLKGELRQSGHRYSRHYYDVFKLLKSDIGKSARCKKELASDCVRHALMFFNSASLDLKNANPGTFSIVPNVEMQQSLRRDYKAMSNMIFGEIPNFDEVIETIIDFEKELNKQRD